MKMKNILVLLAVMCFSFGNAQEISRELSSFKEVKIYNGLQVNLIESDENKAVISGESKDEVRFIIENDILKIRMNLDNIWKEDNTSIEVFYTGLERIEAKQNSEARLSDPIIQNSLTLEVQEGAEIYAKIEVAHLTSEALSGGEIEVSGIAEKQDISITAGGQFYAKNLHSEDIKINISAGGVADVYATEKLDAKVRAGGTVNVYGNPGVIEQNTFLGGKVNRKN